MNDFRFEDYRFTSQRVTTPTPEVAQQMLNVGYRAWSTTLSDSRTPEEIRCVFDPDSEEAVNRQVERMGQLMEDGAYIAAYAHHVDTGENQMVGYVVGSNDVSGSPLAKFVKTTVLRRKPYLWIPSINVLPQFQRHGLGTVLISEVITEPVFDEDQKTTAYVFDENPNARSFFVTRIGMGINPETQTGFNIKQIPDYFGANNRPAKQWRYEGSSVKGAMWIIGQLYGEGLPPVLRLK